MRFYDTRRVVDAVQWTGSNTGEILARLGSRYNVLPIDEPPGLRVVTPYNTPLCEGDWLVAVAEDPRQPVGIVPAEEFAHFLPIPEPTTPGDSA